MVPLPAPEQDAARFNPPRGGEPRGMSIEGNTTLTSLVSIRPGVVSPGE